MGCTLKQLEATMEVGEMIQHAAADRLDAADMQRAREQADRGRGRL